MPATILIALHIFSHLILMTILYSRFNYVLFTERASEVQRI